MSKINSILIFPQKSEEKNKYMDDMGPAYVYFQERPSGLDSRGARGGEFRGK